jgi:hypothetical protein
MAPKSLDQYRIKLTGPGHSFEREVSEDVATSIINLVMTGAAGAAPTPTGPGRALATYVAAGRADSEGQTPKQFMAQKKATNDYQRVACLAYYLANHRSTPQFKTIDITNLSREAAVHITNPSQAVGNATNIYRFLARAEGGKKQLSSLGESVVDALPDREKVKAVVAEGRPRRRKRRGRKK